MAFTRLLPCPACPVQVREPNLKYLALENMARLAEVPAVVDTGVWGRSWHCSNGGCTLCWVDTGGAEQGGQSKFSLGI